MSQMESSASSRGSGDGVRPPSLEQLVAHFVAAKRSLSAAAHVQRAHGIVQAAREALEESAALEASNAFVRRMLGEQARTLEAVRQGVEQVGAEVHDEFTVSFVAAPVRRG
jgi:autophagy-related protein 17